jgi:hypothetical protein
MVEKSLLKVKMYENKQKRKRREKRKKQKQGQVFIEPEAEEESAPVRMPWADAEHEAKESIIIEKINELSVAVQQDFAARRERAAELLQKAHVAALQRGGLHVRIGALRVSHSETDKGARFFIGDLAHIAYFDKVTLAV